MNVFHDGLVAVPEDSASRSPFSLGAWEALMRQGVEAARNGRHTVAEPLYLRALDIAQTLLYLEPAHGGDGSRQGCGDDDRVAAFVVSRLNLADLYRDAGRMDEAVLHLCAAHRTLMALLRNERTPQALQQAVCRHSRETHAALLGHVREHGSHPEVVSALRTGRLPCALLPPHGATVH